MSDPCASTHTESGRTLRCELKHGHEGQHESGSWLWHVYDAALREPTPPHQVMLGGNFENWWASSAVYRGAVGPKDVARSAYIQGIAYAAHNKPEPTPPVDPPSEDWRKLAILRRAVMSVCDEALFKLTPEQVQGFMGQWIARLAGALVEIGISGPGDE